MHCLERRSDPRPKVGVDCFKSIPKRAHDVCRSNASSLMTGHAISSGICAADSQRIGYSMEPKFVLLSDGSTWSRLLSLLSSLSLLAMLYHVIEKGV